MGYKSMILGIFARKAFQGNFLIVFDVDRS